jgi:2'-5' RNA ligase
MEIELEGFSHFGKSVLFLAVKDNTLLQELQNQVMTYFQETFNDVIKNNDRPFHPHITIATRDLKPGDLIKALEHFNNEKYFHSFQTKSISVLKLSPGMWNVIASVDWR